MKKWQINNRFSNNKTKSNKILIKTMRIMGNYKELNQYIQRKEMKKSVSFFFKKVLETKNKINRNIAFKKEVVIEMTLIFIQIKISYA